MAGIESKESSTGVRLLSAYKRGLAQADNLEIIAKGLTTLSSACPEMVVEPPPFPAQPWIYRIRRNFRFIFSGSASINAADPGDISVESAGMRLTTAATPAVLTGDATSRLAGAQSFWNAARLSNTSALAAFMPISFDPWTIDCNDLLTSNPSAQWFQLVEYVVANSVAGVPVELTFDTNFQVDVAQFTDYHFNKWE